MNNIKQIIRELSETLENKNKDYGSAVFFPSPLVNVSASDSILVRMGDKIKRLETLARNKSYCSESFEDTVFDLAGYCVLYLASKRGEAEKKEGLVEEIEDLIFCAEDLADKTRPSSFSSGVIGNKILYEPVTTLEGFEE